MAINTNQPMVDGNKNNYAPNPLVEEKTPDIVIPNPDQEIVDSGVAPQEQQLQEEVQVASAGAGRGGKKIFDILNAATKKSEDIDLEIKAREGTDRPLVQEGLGQKPDLFPTDYSPEEWIKNIDSMPDPLVGGKTTRAGSPLSSDGGINFKWFEFEGGTDAFEAIELIAKNLPEKSVVPQSKTYESAKKALANEIDVLPDLLQGKLGLSARNITAARILLASSSSRMRQLAESAVGEGGKRSQADLLEFRKQAIIHRGIVMSVRGMRSEAGRALNSLRMTVDDQSVDPLIFSMDEFGGSGQAEKMAKMFLKLSTEKGETAANQFAVKAGFTKTIDGLMEIYVHGMISNPITLEKVIIGNAQAFFLNPVDDLMAGIVGKVNPIRGGTGRASMMAAPIRMLAWYQTLGDALAAMSRTFKTGVPVDNMGRFDDAAPRRALDRSAFHPDNQDSVWAHMVHFLGQAIRANAERGMGSVDAFSKTLIAKGEQRVAAYEAGIELTRAGKPIDEVLDEVARIALDPKYSQQGYGESTAARMARATGRATLTSPLQGFARIGAPQRWFNQDKVSGKLMTLGAMSINTFWRVTVNAFSETYRRTPLAPLLLPSTRRALRAGGAERDRALGQIATGSLIMGYIMTECTKGTITGGGVRGSVENKLRKQGINVPPKFSFRMGKNENGDYVYRSYAGLEPIGGLIAAACTVSEAVRDADAVSEQLENLVTAAFMLPLAYLEELPFSEPLYRATGFLRTIGNTDVDQEEATKALLNLTSDVTAALPNMVIPYSAIVRATGRAVDPRKRDPKASPTKDSPAETNVLVANFEQAWNNYARSAPHLAEGIPLLRDIWGEEQLINDDEGWAQYLMPLRKKVSQFDDVDDAFAKLARANGELPFQMPKYQIKGVKITAEMRSDLMEEIRIIGAKSRIRDVMSSRAYLKAESAYPQETVTMANIMSQEYADVKKEAVERVFGWDADNQKFIEGARHAAIGFSIHSRVQRREAGYPQN